MNIKNFIKELILPSFWAFFFVVSSAGKPEKIQIESKKNNELKKQTIISTSLERNIPVENKANTASYINAVYLHVF